MSRLVDDWQYDGPDPAIKLFTACLEAWQFEISDGATVLELGCCESDWARRLKAVRPNVKLWGIDVRECREFPGTFVQGDASSHHWPHEYVDWIIALGSIEHFGLGYYEYGDPVNPWGDSMAVYQAKLALKPGGSLYLDVPYTPAQMTQTPHYRVYDDEGLQKRLTAGLTVKAQGYAKNEDETNLQWVRPEAPFKPFWFVARWMQKV